MDEETEAQRGQVTCESAQGVSASPGTQPSFPSSQDATPPLHQTADCLRNRRAQLWTWAHVGQHAMKNPALTKCVLSQGSMAPGIARESTDWQPRPRAPSPRSSCFAPQGLSGCFDIICGLYPVSAGQAGLRLPETMLDTTRGIPAEVRS